MSPFCQRDSPNGDKSRNPASLRPTGWQATSSSFLVAVSLPKSPNLASPSSSCAATVHYPETFKKISILFFLHFFYPFRKIRWIHFRKGRSTDLSYRSVVGPLIFFKLCILTHFDRLIKNIKIKSAPIFTIILAISASKYVSCVS